MKRDCLFENVELHSSLKNRSILSKSFVNDQVCCVSLIIAIDDKNVVAIGGRVVTHRRYFHFRIPSNTVTDKNVGDEHVSFTSRGASPSVTVTV